MGVGIPNAWQVNLSWSVEKIVAFGVVYVIDGLPRQFDENSAAHFTQKREIFHPENSAHSPNIVTSNRTSWTPNRFRPSHLYNPLALRSAETISNTGLCIPLRGMLFSF